MRALLFLLPVAAILLPAEGFYNPVNLWDAPTFVPKTTEELKRLLCSTFEKEICTDSLPRRIIVDQLFDFTDTEGQDEAGACEFTVGTASCAKPVLAFTESKLCDQRPMKKASRSKAGLEGLMVGSRKIIVGVNGGGLRGKGLKLRESQDVEIKNLVFADINPHAFMSGSGVELVNSRNVLIDGNYFANISYHMVTTRQGSTTGLTISNNLFDGKTAYSVYCDGTSPYLWAFAGHSERITLERNTVLHASGRGPYVRTGEGTVTVVHMRRNTFYNMKRSGAIELKNSGGSLFVEGNVFVDVVEIIHENSGNIFMPQSDEDVKTCSSLLGRACEVNTIVNSGKSTPENNNLQAVKDLSNSLPWSWFMAFKDKFDSMFGAKQETIAA